MTPELILIDHALLKPAAKVLSLAFERDLVSRYFLNHLQRHSPDSLQRIQYNLMKSQLRYYLDHSSQFMIVGVQDQENGAILCVSVWDIPQDTILSKNVSSVVRDSYRKSTLGGIKHRLIDFNTQISVKSNGASKIRKARAATIHAESVIGLQKSMYRLNLIGTLPSCQNKGLATMLVTDVVSNFCSNYSSASITDDLINCDYSNSETTKPLVYLEASSYKNYQLYCKLGFAEFAAVYVRDKDLDDLLAGLSDSEWEEYKEDVEEINGKTYFCFRVMVANRNCTERKVFVW